MMQMKKQTVTTLIGLLIAFCVALMLCAVVAIADNTPLGTAFAASTDVDAGLTLTLTSDGSGYKVVATDKTIEYVTIPQTYNGLPVKEIGDNGFANCKNLKEVKIPYSITRIGRNAFLSCSNLETINGMSRVEYIGNNAFGMCPKLNNLILPHSIKELGSTILRNNPNTVYSRMSESKMMALNTSWIASSTAEVIYGNQLVLTEVYEENGGKTELKGYSIAMDQNLNVDANLILGDTYCFSTKC